MSWGWVWKALPWVCKLVRFVTKRKPRRGKILIVEDDPFDAAILENTIRRLGWECELAKSGEEAEGMARHTFYRAAFIDLRLPTLPGEELLQILSRDSPDTAFVICCGDARDMERIPAGRIVGFVRKPVSPENLQRWLASV